MMFGRGPAITLSVVLLAAAFVFGSDQSLVKPFHFDHGFHVREAELTCDECHANIVELDAGQQSTMDHGACEACHDVEDENECGSCHVDPEDPTGIPPVAGLYEGFAHNAHAEAKLSCVKCHGEMSAAGQQPAVPEMKTCQECHTKSGAPLNCGSCHLGKTPVPDDHGVMGWMMEHGLEAAFDASACEACHTQSTCDDCHQGAVLDGEPHPPSWLFDHFVEAMFGEDCLACHETRESCTSCHRTMIPVPHGFGPEYANSGNGGSHKEEAGAFLEACLSCHDVGAGDPTCARCHD